MPTQRVRRAGGAGVWSWIWVSSAVALLCLSTPGEARADVPPPDVCSKEGKACTAPGVAAGICKKETCGRRDPSGKYVSRPCLRCFPDKSKAAASKKGCDIVPDEGLSGGLGAALTMLLLFAAAVLLTRRRGRSNEGDTGAGSERS
jgi:hypothetical protein